MACKFFFVFIVTLRLCVADTRKSQLRLTTGFVLCGLITQCGFCSDVLVHTTLVNQISAAAVRYCLFCCSQDLVSVRALFSFIFVLREQLSRIVDNINF